MSLSMGGSFAAVICDSPRCRSIVKVPASEGESSHSLAERARDMLVHEGWSKDSRGQDRCPECSGIAA
jgi:hypothetical protein